jgi:dolichyl-diphosphooligosaccharide--protein glycosyltransferase
MSWWDFGYWITRIAHRIPNANPSQAAYPIKQVANFFLSQNQSAAEDIRKEMGSAYLISDYDISVGKLPAVITHAGQDVEKYMPPYYIAQQDQLAPVQLFSLDYYRTMIVRLYNFDGKAVPEGTPVVLSYNMIQTTSGTEVKQITDVKNFTTYQDALNYVASQNSTAKYDIVGTDPFISPIPLLAVENYKEIYNSAVSDNTTPKNQVVKIFEYTGNK